MAARYLLDTNTASCIIKGEPPQVRQRLLQVPMEALVVSTITEAELLYGGARRPDARGLYRAIEEFLLRVDVLPWGRDAARSFSVLRAASASKGITLGAMDLLIAAHALAISATLVSSDKAFRLVEQLPVEDWAAPV